MSLNLGTAYSSIEVRLDRMERQLAEAQSKFAATGKKLDNEAAKIKRNLSQSFGDLGRSLTVGLTAPIAALGTAAVKAAVDMDSLKRGLRAVAGSSVEAERQMKRLQDVAKLPGLGLKEAIQGSTNLQAAGLNARLAERALMGFGNALATVGKGKAELDGVITALSQIQSKGKVTAEEINQLAERVPQIRRVMIDAFGTADTEILQKAKISSKEFIETITSAMENLPRVAGGAQNAFENFGDAANKALTAIGDTLLPTVTQALEKFTPILEDIAKNFGKLPSAVKTGLGGLAIGGAIVGPALIGLGAIRKAIDAIGAAPALKFLARFAGLPAVAGAGTFGFLGATLGSTNDRENPSDAVRNAIATERVGRRGIDDHRRIQELTRLIGDYNRRRAAIDKYPRADRLRLAEQNKERLQELRAMMGEGRVAPVIGPGGNTIDAAERARRNEEAKDRARESAAAAKRLRERQAEARKEFDADMAGFRSKFSESRVRAEQEFREKIPLLGMPKASAWLDARLKQIQTEEDAERAAIKARNQRRIEELKREIEQETKEVQAKRKQEIKDRTDFMKRVYETQENLENAHRKKVQQGTEFEQRVRELDAKNRKAFQEQELADRKAHLDKLSDLAAFEKRVKETFEAPIEAARQKNIQRNKDEQDFMDRVMGTARRNEVLPSQQLQRAEDQIRRSLGGHLGTEVAFGFVDAFADGLDKAFGRSSIGRVFARGLARWLDKEVSNMLDNLFSGLAKKKGGAGGGGGGLLGSLIPLVGLGMGLGGLFKGLKFAEGGWVPGPIGQPQPATVHGGEFVLSRKMIEQGAMGGVTVNLGGVTISNDYDVGRMIDRISWEAKRKLAVNPGAV